MNPTSFSNEGRRWMLVDDNTEFLAILRAAAKNFTNAIIECHDSPQSALAAFAAVPGSYELVITDLEMPGMNGVELCRLLHDISPLQRVFLATGSGFFTDAAAQYAGFNALLNKPFSLVALQEALTAAGLESECAHAT